MTKIRPFAPGDTVRLEWDCGACEGVGEVRGYACTVCDQGKMRATYGPIATVEARKLSWLLGYDVKPEEFSAWIKMWGKPPSARRASEGFFNKAYPHGNVPDWWWWAR